MKEYVKPELYYESFELSQHIAGCYLELKNLDVNNCAASGTVGKYTLDSWFVPNVTSGCTVEPEGYCYTNSFQSLTTINS